MKKRKLILFILILVPLFSAICYTLVVAATSKKPRYNIGIVTDGPMKTIPGGTLMLQDEISRMLAGEWDVVFPEEMSHAADMTSRGVNRLLDSLLADPECDLVIMLGMVGSTEALKRSGFNKPVIAPLVYDAVLQNAPRNDVGSGITNLYYIDLGVPIDNAVRAFQDLVSFNSLALLIDERDVRGVQVLRELGTYLSHKHSVDAKVIPVSNSVDNAMVKIDADTEAVLVTGLWQLPPDDIELLSSRLRERKLPSLSLAISEYLEAGMFATTTAPGSVEQLFRQVAINIQDIFLGEAPETLPVASSSYYKLSINMATARAIDVYPSLEYMTGTRLINQEQLNITRKLTLFQAIDEALKANLDLAVAEREVVVGKYEVQEYRSALLPQLSLSLNGNIVDNDRATISGGSLPERSLAGSLSVSQLIYSEDNWANYAVAGYSQEGREYLRDSTRLDIIYKASTTYLKVLRLKALEQIQRDNMDLTQANLERSKIRLQSGVAGPDEMYRWQTQFASDRKAVLQAEADVLNAKQELNQILNRPQTEEFATVETDLKDPMLIGDGASFHNFMHKPDYFLKLRDFALTEGCNFSPELKAIDAELKARKRILVKAKRAYWAPTVSLEASASELLAEDGDGLRSDTDRLDDSEWQVGIVASLPLYEGGRKSATTSKSKEELIRLNTERRNTLEIINNRILQALNSVRVSYPSINLSRDAVDASRDNLQLISDSYVQGVKSIIDLVDAQNQSLQAELDLANAVYDFHTDLMGVQRSMGNFIMLHSAAEKKEWMDRLNTSL